MSESVNSVNSDISSIKLAGLLLGLSKVAKMVKNSQNSVVNGVTVVSPCPCIERHSRVLNPEINK